MTRQMRGFARVAAAIPRCRVADFEANRHEILQLWREAHSEGCAVVVFPEMSISAYSVRDLLLDHHLLNACREGLLALVAASEELSPLAIVGLPLRVGSAIYNVAACIQGGQLLALVPKAYLPNYREFEETRWFRAGRELDEGMELEIGGQRVPFGTDILLCGVENPDLVLAVEICEDYWVQLPPSAFAVGAGATVVCNLSASNFTIGKAELRRLLACSASDRGKCAHVYVAAGPGESSTDLAFDADAFVYENGGLLEASERFSRENQLVIADVDLELLVRERLVTTSFNDCAVDNARDFRRVPFEAPMGVGGELRRLVSAHPFLPRDPATLASRCWETFEIQTNALATRMEATGLDTLVLGVSGGLDSTHAALVAAAALDLMEFPRENLRCVTMPGLGTTVGTRTNAEQLVRALDATFCEISVSESARLILSQVDHPAAEETTEVTELIERVQQDPELGDVTLENVQARLRTLILMTLANQHAGLVVGTGDLSEKALGWSTYAGDHIAMYDVNAGVPKTLIQFVIRWVANERLATWSKGDQGLLRRTLFSILDTPISPELLPADAAGRIAQLTEEAVGPYELHDFFLYHLVRHGARPAKILDLARIAFAGRYDMEEIKRWLVVFLRRFFDNQFKRSCTADGPKVGMVALSPRGDWRMPSDACVRSWLDEVVRYPQP